MERIVWQPVLNESYDLAVSLDRTFAKEMLNAKISFELQEKMNTLGEDFLKNKGITTPTPYTFYENTCLIRRCDVNRAQGRWLNLE